MPGIAQANSKPPSPAALRPVQADGVRRTAARDEDASLDARLRELAGEPEDEPVDAVVGGEQVRAEADRRDAEPALLRGAQHLLELGERPRLGERARRAAGADRGQPREPTPS